MARLKCFTCKQRLKLVQVGARVYSGGVDICWCLTCWDNDPDALAAYQLASLAADPGSFFRKVPV